MANNSAIEWTQATWNPVTGCNKTSPGCKNCYAEKMSLRLKLMGQKNYRNGFKLTLQPDMLERPLQWKTPKLIFVNSMSDLFHKDVPLEYLKRAFEIMNRANWHQFQVLTKRSERLAELSHHFNWTKNIWMGVSVESNDYQFRINDLRKTSAQIKFISAEPLLGPLDNMKLKNIDWVIVGGESGPGAREVKKEWIVGIKNQCAKAKVPFFFKQWGGVRKDKTGRLLNGRTWDQMPIEM